jgi:pilus assembly protein CpaC
LVAVNQSLILPLDSVSQIAVANPEIADVAIMSNSEVLLIGKTVGTTTIHFWTPAGRITYEVEVGANDAGIADTIKNLLKYPNITVSKVDKTVLLEGSVNDQYQKDRAEKVAAAYGDKVVNLLEVTSPRQVKIEAKVVEITLNNTENLGMLFEVPNQTTPGVFTFGQNSTNAVGGQSIFGKLGTYDAITGQLNLLLQRGTAKILSQPNIVAVSGEKAKIVVGGQIPVPVSNSNGTVTVDWKEYGIKLEIQPEVQSSGRIHSTIVAEVSALDKADAVTLSGGLSIPAITTRRAESVVNMEPGQTMVIGGLISSNVQVTNSKIPFMGDLPLIGQLFQNHNSQVVKTEIVVILTPTLVADGTANITPEVNEVIKDGQVLK